MIHILQRIAVKSAVQVAIKSESSGAGKGTVIGVKQNLSDVLFQTSTQPT